MSTFSSEFISILSKDFEDSKHLGNVAVVDWNIVYFRGWKIRTTFSGKEYDIMFKLVK